MHLCGLFTDLTTAEIPFSPFFTLLFVAEWGQVAKEGCPWGKPIPKTHGNALNPARFGLQLAPKNRPISYSNYKLYG